MQGAQEEYNYEAERQKLKLSPFATCVLMFKTTVGVGIFTYQYAYAKVISVDQCGIILGTLLSMLVFYMAIYGIFRLVQLCDYIEEMETDKKKKLSKPASEQVQSQHPQPQDPPVELKDQNSISKDKTEAPINIELKGVDNYEVEAETEKFKVITYHRRLG